MAKNTIYDYSTSAASNTDISGIGTQGSNLVSNFDDAFRTIMAHIAVDVAPRRFSIQGMLFGLTLSNNVGDAVNDIDIAIGMASTDSATDPRTMVLASAVTKRLDAAWVVGTNQGGLDTGAIANATYHVWLIQRSDTSVVDVLFSLSATAPTMPASYDRKRRIGAIVRQSAAILAFTQVGDDFLLVTPLNDISASPTTTAVLAAISVPTGLKLTAKLSGRLQNATTVSASSVLVSSPDQADVAPFTPTGNATAQCAVINIPVAFRTDIRTNTSAQIRYVGGNATTGLNIATLGWVDTRGRFV